MYSNILIQFENKLTATEASLFGVIQALKTEGMNPGCKVQPEVGVMASVSVILNSGSFVGL